MIVIHITRKPIAKASVAANVLEYGTGAINVDGCRIESGTDYTDLDVTQGVNKAQTSYAVALQRREFTPASGRWPTNIILEHRKRCRVAGTRKVKKPGGHTKWPDYDGPEWQGMQGKHSQVAHYDPDGLETVDDYVCADDCPVADLDAQNESTAPSYRPNPSKTKELRRVAYGYFRTGVRGERGYPDIGGVARFFKQVEPDQEFKRSHHLAPCPECGKPAIDHPTDGKMPFMTVLCDGARVKL